MKTRPSGEKRRKEMQRQERNRAKEERRKLRKEERLKSPTGGVEGDPDFVQAEVEVLEEPPLPSV